MKKKRYIKCPYCGTICIYPENLTKEEILKEHIQKFQCCDEKRAYTNKQGVVVPLRG